MLEHTPPLSEIKEPIIAPLKVGNWYPHLRLFINSNAFDKVLQTLLGEYNLSYRITPQFKNIFRTFGVCPFDICKVVIFTEDLNPYIYKYTGIAYSQDITNILDNNLKDIYKEIKNTVDPKYKSKSDLTFWSAQGVLLLTSALTTTLGKKEAHVELWKSWNNTLFDVFKHDLPEAVYVLIGESVWDYEKKLNKKSVVMKFDTPRKKFPENWGSDMFNKVNQQLQIKNKSLINW